jgi:hypothetical protein
MPVGRRGGCHAGRSAHGDSQKKSAQEIEGIAKLEDRYQQETCGRVSLPVGNFGLILAHEVDLPDS